MDTYGWTTAQVSLSFTAVNAAAAVTPLLAGKALQYLAPRTLMLLGGVIFGLGIGSLGLARSLTSLYGFGILAGFGGGLIYPGATMANLMRLFPERRGLASGLLTGGFGLGTVVWAPAAVAMVADWGISWTLGLMGAVFFLVVALCSRLVVTAPPLAESSTLSPLPGLSSPSRQPGRPRTFQLAQPSRTDRDWKHMLLTPVFWILALLFVIGITSGTMIIGHASPIAQRLLGLSPEAAGLVVSLVALGMMAGKMCWGALSDRIGRTPVLAAMLVLAVLALLSVWQTTLYFSVVGGMFVVGTCYGGFLALIGPVTTDAFGARHVGTNFGIMYLSVAVALFLGPRLAAVASEKSGGDYDWAFLIAALMSAVGLLLVGAYVLLQRQRGTQPVPEK